MGGVMIGKAEQSDRISGLGSVWFEKAFEAMASGRRQDATVAQLAFEMCRAAHRHLAGDDPHDLSDPDIP